MAPASKKPARRGHKFLTLTIVLSFVPEARALGVSKVARSAQGFLGAYKRARGNPLALSDFWRAKREGFIRRHMAQALKNGERLSFAKMTRRHLALIMWAYTPARW